MTSSTGSQDPTPASPVLLGGEMTGWQDGVDPPTALTEWVAVALERAEGSVLLIGPRAASLARRLGGRADVLVRGTRDATRLVAEGASVRCGGLDRLPHQISYDAVVLLDGPERVLTPDSPGLGYADVLDLAVAHADGQFIAYVPNALARTPLSQGHASGETSWWVGTPGYDDRAPVGPELPDPPARLVLGDTAVVDSLRAGEPLTATTLRAALAGQQHWLDVIDADTTRTLATGWVFVRGTALPDDLPAVFAPTLPSPSVTAGEPLEVLLTDALRCGDQERTGSLVGRYADLVHALPQDQRALCVPRNVVRTPTGDLALRVDPDMHPAGTRSLNAPSVSVAVAHGLLDVAALVSGTSGHPYPPELDTVGVARELGVWADLDDDVWRHGEGVRHAAGLPERHTAPPSAAGEASRVAQLESTLRERQTQIERLQEMATRQERRIRAFEHAIETEHGPRARRALFVMTAPTFRLVEAARNRLRHRSEGR